MSSKTVNVYKKFIVNPTTNLSGGTISDSSLLCSLLSSRRGVPLLAEEPCIQQAESPRNTHGHPEDTAPLAPHQRDTTSQLQHEK